MSVDLDIFGLFDLRLQAEVFTPKSQDLRNPGYGRVDALSLSKGKNAQVSRAWNQWKR